MIKKWIHVVLFNFDILIVFDDRTFLFTFRICWHEKWIVCINLIDNDRTERNHRNPLQVNVIQPAKCEPSDKLIPIN